MHKRVLHVEVIGVVENGDGITSLSLGDRSGVLIGNNRSTVFCDSSHDEGIWRGKSSRKVGGARISGKAQIGAFHTKKVR